MKIESTAEENLYPAMHFTPVLTTNSAFVIPDKSLRKLSIRRATDPIFQKNGYSHFVCEDDRLCHKKKSIHLFLAALTLFSFERQASTLWLRQDSFVDSDAPVIAGTISLAAPIQLFLHQCGFEIVPKESLVSFSDFNFLQGLVLPILLKQVG